MSKTQHCQACYGYTMEPLLDNHTQTGEFERIPCPGLPPCAVCAERERVRAKWGVEPCEQCAAKNQEIARLEAELKSCEVALAYELDR